MRERVAILYSHGPHFARAVKRVRADFAETEAFALLPPATPAVVRDALPVEVTRLETPGGAWGTLRFLRAQRFDGLVVLFPSPKLRLLAALSAARQRWVCGPDARLLPLDETALDVVRDRALQRVHGTLLYLRLWWAVRLRRVKR